MDGASRPFRAWESVSAMDSPCLRLDNPHYAEMLTDAALCVLWIVASTD